MATVYETSSLALAQKRAGRLNEAEQLYGQVVALEPTNADAWQNRAFCAYRLGRLADASSYVGKSLELQPDHAPAWHTLGLIQQAQGNSAAALASLRRAVQLDPSAAALCTLGNLLQEQELAAEAIDCCRRAIEIQPDLAEAHSNLGIALQKIGNVSDAIACYQRAIVLKPGFAQAYSNLGIALNELGKFDEAAASFRQAISLDPSLVPANLNLSMVELLQGDFENGWKRYQWRWKAPGNAAPVLRQPMWNGEPLAGKTIMLYTEQGFGDAIQFVRYAPLVQRLGARVVVGCQSRLLKLLARCGGIDQLVGEGEALPDFDYQLSLMELPRVLRTTLSTIPAEIPYVFAQPELIDDWRGQLAGIEGFRIGVNWQGRKGTMFSQVRDIPLGHFQSLAELPGVKLISLQKGDGAIDLTGIDEHARIIDLGDFDSARGAFMDTAAVMMNLDLVISSDTSVVHLAGALGISVWVALPFVADWRWLIGRADSPWYPTMRLFRQPAAGDWASVFAQIRAALASTMLARIKRSDEC